MAAWSPISSWMPPRARPDHGVTLSISGMPKAMRIEREIHRLRSLQDKSDAEQLNKEQVQRHFQNLLRAVAHQTLDEKHRQGLTSVGLCGELTS